MVVSQCLRELWTEYKEITEANTTLTDLPDTFPEFVEEFLNDGELEGFREWYFTPSPLTFDQVVASSIVPLREHQISLARWFRDRNRGAVAVHSTGTGKTLAAVAVIQTCMSLWLSGRTETIQIAPTTGRSSVKQYPTKGRPLQVLIVTPISLELNFKKEIAKFGLDIEVINASGLVNIQFIGYQKLVNVYLKGEDGPNKVCPLERTLLIIDEGHNLRTEIKRGATQSREGTKRAQGVRAGVALECAKRAWRVFILTATPIYNAPRDVINLVAMVRGTKALTESQFKRMSFRPSEFKRYVAGVFSFHTIDRDTSEDYPSVEEHEVHVPMSVAYYRKYRNVEKKNSGMFKEPWVFLNGMRQATNAFPECDKCEWVMDVLREYIPQGEKIVVYSAYITHGIRKLAQDIETEGFDYAQVTGEFTPEQRDISVRMYNSDEPETPNILLITKAGGEGLDLRGTRKIILLESGWNRPGELQVQGRAIRYRSHSHLPLEERRVDVYNLRLVKPPELKARERKPRGSADMILKETVDRKEEVAGEYIEMMKEVSIETME